MTFQQAQKYDNGKNRVSASRLQHISHVLRVPVPLFFEGVPTVKGRRDDQKGAPSPTYVSDFLATSDGLALTKAFVRIKDATLRRRIVTLVREIAGAGE